MKQPDPKFHLYVSLVKSAIRIVAGLSLILYPTPDGIIAAGAFLVVAEILGIAEELV